VQQFFLVDSGVNLAEACFCFGLILLPFASGFSILFSCFVSREYSDHRSILISCFLSYCLRSARTLFLLIFLLALSARDFRSVSHVPDSGSSRQRSCVCPGQRRPALSRYVCLFVRSTIFCFILCCSARVWPVRPGLCIGARTGLHGDSFPALSLRFVRQENRSTPPEPSSL
jgi:hypothetical protein